MQFATLKMLSKISVDEALFPDFAFKNRAPDFEYPRRSWNTRSTIPGLAMSLDGGQGPLSTLRELRNRFSHDQIVVPAQLGVRLLLCAHSDDR